MKKFAILPACAFAALVIQAQTIAKPATSENFRGLSTPSEKVVWASGTHGTYVKTVDGGLHWSVAQVPDSASLDFRDVEAFSGDLAYLLAAGPGEQSRIYKTDDGGKTWSLQFTNKDPKGFFDCMAFWDKDHGIAVGDPVNGKFQVIKTENGGKDWKPIPCGNLPAAVEGEGAFAASGTCLVTQGKRNVWFATGGTAARVFHSADGGGTWMVSETPIAHAKPSQGIFSLSFRDSREGIVVGGDYASPKSASDNIALTFDGGVTWKLIKNGSGSVYLSAVAYLTKRQLVAVGSEGFMYSDDGGNKWKLVRRAGFNALAVVTFYPNQGYVVAGSGGRVDKYWTHVELKAGWHPALVGMLR